MNIICPNNNTHGLMTVLGSEIMVWASSRAGDEETKLLVIQRCGICKMVVEIQLPIIITQRTCT